LLACLLPQIVSPHEDGSFRGGSLDEGL